MLDAKFKAQIGQFVGRTFPAAELVDVQQLTAGASQQTFRVSVRQREGHEAHYALRRAQPGLERTTYGQVTPSVEAELLELASFAQVPVPKVIESLQSTDGLGDGYLMEWLEGETMGQRIVKLPELEAAREKLAFECGQALARIHAIEVPDTLRQVLHSVSPEALVRETWDAYIALETPEPMIDFTAQWLLRNVPPQSDSALVHGDFRNGNLMVSREGITAVLDWELCHLGDPMRDLGWLCVNSWRFGRRDLPVGGFGTVDDLVAGYEVESGGCVDRGALHFWEVFGSFWWSVTTLGMAKTWRTGETPSVERPVIGRRSSEAQMDCVNLLIPGYIDPLIPQREETELPTSVELVSSVRTHLKTSVLESLDGADKFLLRVAMNSLAIAERELQFGPVLEAEELSRLTTLLGEGELATLRWKLVHDLRSGVFPAEAPLHEHLRSTVAGRLAIDQPTYSALVSTS
ncbi:MAG: phosphotransferase family protein [Luminiphilus sp.]|nr:phosphotransferase family protein [Luminiphilus sp.]